MKGQEQLTALIHKSPDESHFPGSEPADGRENRESSRSFKFTLFKNGTLFEVTALRLQLIDQFIKQADPGFRPVKDGD